ncbi:MULTISPECIES: hypothetical protein [unclassified Desulfovibrio]|uniref:hypothetical protein n=1 Tax=unclassified Desulfovibrio TaxID=2593640 RepID=UPI0013E9E24F|nr:MULTISPECIES: hypothetical protein [unclassified Desulfovibrio]
MTLENFIRERADVLAYEAECYPATAHVAQTWLDNALRWAGERNATDLEEHLLKRLNRLSCIRWKRLGVSNSAFAVG